MKKFKKSLAILATLAMVLSLTTISAFAAPIGDGVATTSDTQITVPKGVTFINEDAVTSYGPGITFSYSLAPAATGDVLTVSDANDNITTVHPGPAEGLYFTSSAADNFTATSKTAATLSFPATETFTTSASGVQSTKNLVMAFDNSKFSRAGIYRYVITDTTTTANLYAAGMTRDDNYDETRYIDVFVKRNASGAMEVYGYALKLNNDASTDASDKDPGYVSSSPAEDGTDAETDRYETYNVTLEKTVSGTLGDFQHEFPFAISVANDGKNYYAAKGDINAAKAATPDAATSKSTSLKHTEVYTIAGLSPHATVAYQETNDTTDLYIVSVAGSTSAISVTENAAAKTYSIAADFVSDYEDQNSATSVHDLGAATNYDAVTYTNTLDEVSPTGFVQHFGMVLMIMMAGMFLLFAGMKTTEDEEL